VLETGRNIPVNRTIHKILVAIALISVFCHALLAADDPSFVPVAFYSIAPASETLGSRAYAILREHNIKSISVGMSGGVSIDVAEEHAQEALKLLAAAINSEGLQLTLIKPKGSGWVGVTPESILEPKKRQ
jgi:hypothetical protein